MGQVPHISEDHRSTRLHKPAERRKLGITSTSQRVRTVKADMELKCLWKLDCKSLPDRFRETMITINLCASTRSSVRVVILARTTVLVDRGLVGFRHGAEKPSPNLSLPEVKSTCKQRFAVSGPFSSHYDRKTR